MSYPTRRLLSTLSRKNEYRIRLHNRSGDVENIMLVYIPDFSILRSPYTKVLQVPGAYYFPYYFFRLFLAFLKISSQKHTQNCPSAAHGEHIHLCLAVISNHWGNISTPMAQVVPSKEPYGTDQSTYSYSTLTLGRRHTVRFLAQINI